jgi:predicted DNA-binding antitoxin AbrB/MazE fold protein
MPIVVEATYENGVLKPETKLPLDELEKVTLTVEPKKSWVERTYGIVEWTGDPDELERLAMDPELDPLESA